MNKIILLSFIICSLLFLYIGNMLIDIRRDILDLQELVKRNNTKIQELQVAVDSSLAEKEMLLFIANGYANYVLKGDKEVRK